MTSVTLALYGGLLVLGLLLLQAAAALGVAVQRYRHERAIQQKDVERLQQQLETARIRRLDRGREIDAWSGYRKFEVAEKQEEGGGICSFYLRPHDHKSIPGFRPGQFLTFRLRPDPQEAPVVRCYSLSDAPGRDTYRVTIKRIPPPPKEPDAPPGLVSGFFHDRIETGSIVDVKAPAGGFSLDVSERSPIVLLAGGVGITPLLSMLNAVLDRGFNREVHLFYGVRNLDEAIMGEHFEETVRQHAGRFHMHLCLSSATPDTLPDSTASDIVFHAGYLDVNRLKQVLPSNNFDFYICGPPPMMTGLTGGLDEWGVPSSNIHFEAFGPASVPRAKPDADGAHDVSFLKSGKRLSWDPSCESILAFAEKNGVVIDSGCRAGSCGSCLTAIREGKIEYLRDPSDAPEPGSCLTCISVPSSDLELDA
jgi:ferredoxin-NADP reductase